MNKPFKHIKRPPMHFLNRIRMYNEFSDLVFFFFNFAISHLPCSLYMAAKSMESAANLAAQQLKQPERASEMYKKASDLYQAHMTPDRAGEMLEKAARWFFLYS